MWLCDGHHVFHSYLEIVLLLIYQIADGEIEKSKERA
jgi:hypothetical protein